MKKGTLYEYALLFHPKPMKDANGNETQAKTLLLKAPTWIVAYTPEEVSILASRSIPEDYLDQLDQVEILVRPFG